MRVRIIVRKRRAPDGEEILRRILGDLGLSCSFDEQLPEQQAADPSEELLLIDAREMQKEALRRLERLAAQKRFAHIIALTRKEEQTHRKVNLMQAGVEMIVPFDQPQLKVHLSIALQELFGRPDGR